MEDSNLVLREPLRSSHDRVTAVLSDMAAAKAAEERTVPCTEILIRQRGPAQDTNVLWEGSVQGHRIVHFIWRLQLCLPLPSQGSHVERHHLRVRISGFSCNRFKLLLR